MTPPPTKQCHALAADLPDLVPSHKKYTTHVQQMLYFLGKQDPSFLQVWAGALT